MDTSKPLWIGSYTDIREGQAALEALKTASDAKYWQPDVGIIQVDDARWQQAQTFEKDVWLKHARAAESDRNEEHLANFDHYHPLPPDLGNTVEIGCGPFTQLRTILSSGHTASRITLIDPLLSTYLQHPHCAYVDSYLSGIPVQMLTMAAEDFEYPVTFDTIICINVIEHVHNALAVLRNIHTNLKPGGHVVFHERSWDYINIETLYDIGHPIRVKQALLDSFYSQFTPVFNKNNYFIGRK